MADAFARRIIDSDRPTSRGLPPGGRRIGPTCTPLSNDVSQTNRDLAESRAAASGGRRPTRQLFRASFPALFEPTIRNFKAAGARALDNDIPVPRAQFDLANVTDRRRVSTL